MELQIGTDRIFALDGGGKLVAEITFPVREGRADVNHTFVDDSLRGQGMAAHLVEAAARQLRERGLKADLTCSYAKKWFAGHGEYGDLLE